MTIPFVDLGRDWDGCDCWGIVRLIYQEELGIELNHYGGITVHDIMRVVRTLNKEFRQSWSKVETPKEFDVAAMMNGTDNKSFSHCGIMVSDTTILHMREDSGCMASRIDDPETQSLILGFYRHGARS